MAKTLPGDFKVITPKIPLLSQQVVTSKGIQYLIPTYSWTLIPIPNWTFSVVTISPFNAWLPSTRLQSPTRESCWLQSSSVHPHDEDQEDTWSQNPMVHIHSNFFKKDELGQNFVSCHNLLEQTFLKAYATCELFDGP